MDENSVIAIGNEIWKENIPEKEFNIALLKRLDPHKLNAQVKITYHQINDRKMNNLMIINLYNKDTEEIIGYLYLR